jgi:transposase
MKKTQRILNQLICDLKNGDFKYQPKEEKEIVWASYNTAKINEMHFFLTFVKEAVDIVKLEEQKTRQSGRPTMNAYDLAKIILVQMYFQTAERQASGLALLFKEKLMMSEVPSPRTIGRAYSREDVQYILNKVFEMTNASILDKEGSFSGDGTGLPLSIKQNYENDRENMAKHAGYDKLAVMISNNFHIATACVHANGTANDSPLFRPLMIETSQRFQNISDVELDAGYVSRGNCDLISNAGAMPYIYPKKGTTLNRSGSGSWRNMLENLVANPQEWLRAYHARSQSECYFSSHKRRFTRPLLKKKHILRGVEAFSRVTVLNICMLILAYFEHGVRVKQFDQSYL